MPTIKSISGRYRFFFYSFDCNVSEHVHVQREIRVCKYWRTPVALARNDGFSARELNQIRDEVVRNVEKILEAWHAAMTNIEPRIQSVSVSENSSHFCPVTRRSHDQCAFSVVMAPIRGNS